ncbi:MAG: UvrD-helicase domain-containing protein, partial [Oscillospiraceae bacterium]
MTFNNNADHFLDLRRKAIEKRFSSLNNMQRKAVLKTEGPLLIMAGAGSGKTTVLINRVANLLLFGNAYESTDIFGNSDYLIPELEGYLEGKLKEEDSASLFEKLSVNRPRPWEILAITFTNKAAGELKERLVSMLGDLGGRVAASTFHAACVRILRSEIDALGYKKTFTIYDSDDSQRVIKECMRELNVDEKSYPPKMISSVMGTAKDNFETPSDMLDKARKKDDFRLLKIAEVYNAYNRKLFAADAVDFDDIIALTVKIFENDKEVLAKYQKKYHYIMVDEYQDTNHAQYKLVSLLAGGYNNICVVGDDDQSIYKFRGADIENILSFEKEYAGATVIKLEQNYRSTQTILDAANHVIQNNAGRKGKTLWTSAPAGEKIKVYKADDERDEANYIGRCISQLVADGKKYGDCAVLYRLNAQSATIESAFILSGIPYKIVGGTRFNDRKEIKDIMAYLSVIENRSDVLRIKRIINEPKRGIGEATITTATEISGVLENEFFDIIKNAEQYAPLSKKAGALRKFTDIIDDLASSLATVPLDEMIDVVLEKTGYQTMLKAEGVQGETRLENIKELKTQIKRYIEETEEPSLSGFLEEMALYTEMDNYEEETDKVT